MSEDFLDDSYKAPQAKRPMFLQVLCILTFVSCGLTLLTSLWGIFTAGMQERNLQRMNRISQQQDMPEIMDKMSEAMEKSHDWLVIGNYLSLGNVLICFLGAMLMWRLRKPGFYIYTFGQILPWISFYGLYTSYQNVPFMGPVMLISSFLGILISAGFIVMYGLNLKHMR